MGILSAALLSPFSCELPWSITARRPPIASTTLWTQAGAEVERFHLELGRSGARHRTSTGRDSGRGHGRLRRRLSSLARSREGLDPRPGRVRRPGPRDLPRLPSCWPMPWAEGPSRPSCPKPAVVPITSPPRARPIRWSRRSVPWCTRCIRTPSSCRPDATLLAHSDRFPHAFRLGSALALQFHPDADLDLALAWGKEDGSIWHAAGIDYDDYAQGLIAAEPQARSRLAGHLHGLAGNVIDAERVARPAGRRPVRLRAGHPPGRGGESSITIEMPVGGVDDQFPRWAARRRPVLLG